MIKTKLKMTIAELKKKWLGLSENNFTEGFRSLRISKECLSDIFIGVNKDSNRCLILLLPKEFEVDFKEVIKENLKIEFFDKSNLIVLQLTDNSFYDVFDDLVISLYQRIKDVANAKKYSREFILAFHKWSEFFEDKKSDLLQENIIKGLVGELFVLKSLVDESKSIQVNDILNSWKGPYDKGHDFELDIKDIEVKTKNALKLDITISSEYQLEKQLGKELELLVVSVDANSNTGKSIEDIVIEIKNSIIEMLGDTSILLKAIGQKGLTLKNLSQYNNFRFKLISMVTYNCSSIGFPKLIKSNIPQEINCLSYDIRISLLDEHIIYKILF